MKAIKNECMTTFKAGRQFYIWTILNWCDFLDLNEGAKRFLKYLLCVMLQECEKRMSFRNAENKFLKGEDKGFFKH